MKPFQLLTPSSLDEVLVFLARHRERARLIAGGTDLFLRMEQGVLGPDFLIDLKRVQGINGITYDGGSGLIIGATVLHSEIQASSLIREKYRALHQGARWVGSVQIRNRATVGGNLCNASPAADVAVPLVALGANMVLARSSGRRTIPVDEFFLGPGRTAMEADEMLLEVQVPAAPSYSGSEFLRRTRTMVDIAVVSVAAAVSLESATGPCREVRIALGAVGPTPLRAKGAEAQVRGKGFSEALIHEAAQAAASEARPISDVRGSAEYRREMVRVLTRRALTAAWDQARNWNG